jgi:hypothetical protein
VTTTGGEQKRNFVARLRRAFKNDHPDDIVLFVDQYDLKPGTPWTPTSHRFVKQPSVRASALPAQLSMPP